MPGEFLLFAVWESEFPRQGLQHGGSLKNGVPNFQNVWLSNICYQAQGYFLTSLFYFVLIKLFRQNQCVIL